MLPTATALRDPQMRNRNADARNNPLIYTDPAGRMVWRIAAAADRGGLTAAGRALQEHGGREGSAFPAARHSPPSINRQGQRVIDDILANPARTTLTRHHARFGQIKDVRAPAVEVCYKEQMASSSCFRSQANEFHH